MSPELSSVDKTNKNWLPRQRTLRDRKTNTAIVLPTTKKLAKIGPLDFEMVGLTGVVKQQETAAEHIACRTAAGRAK